MATQGAATYIVTIFPFPFGMATLMLGVYVLCLCSTKVLFLRVYLSVLRYLHANWLIQAISNVIILSEYKVVLLETLQRFWECFLFWTDKQGFGKCSGSFPTRHAGTN